MVDVAEQDQWITHLSDCKQLSENDVKRLCDKVCELRSLCVYVCSDLVRHAKSYSMNPTSNRSAAL